MRHAAVLTLGAALAAATLAGTGVATSQTLSTVDNDQTQNADVLANGTLNVVDVDTVNQTVNTLGNGYTAQVTAGQMNVSNAQELNGNVQSDSKVTASVYAYEVDQFTSATGNSGQADSLGYGDMDLQSYQHVGDSAVLAKTTLTATNAQVDNINGKAQAIGNSQSFSQIGAYAGVQIDQANEGVIQADGVYSFRYLTGAANTTASAIANNVSGAGINGSAQDIEINQEMNGQRTQASQTVSAANAQEINASSTAVANNITLSNSDNPLSVASTQTNNAYVRGETEVYAYSYGAASAQALGVANSSSVAQIGEEISLDNSQFSSSGVEVIAKFTGGGGIGYDSSTSATAMGNASTAYACTSCGDARMSITNHQRNDGQVRATSSQSISADSRNVSSVATAVGNTATYYVNQQSE